MLTPVPDDANEEHYRRYAAKCVEHARKAADGQMRTVFLSLAQKWLQLANSQFANRDTLSAAVDEFNENQFHKH
jgi:hypothetical protein